MDQNQKRFMAALLALAIMASSAFAAGAGIPPTASQPGTAGNSLFLQARSINLGCAIGFYASEINDIASKAPSANSALTAASAALQSDNSHLVTLASAGNSAQFDSFVNGTLSKDAQGALAAIKGVRQNYKSYNITSETMSSLRSDFATERSAYASCESNAMVALGNARISQYNDVINGWQASAAMLSAKGVNTTGMQTVIDGAKGNVIVPLQAAVNTGNSTQIRAALQGYCLGDWCGAKDDGTAPYDYHGFAQISLARLQAALGKLLAASPQSTLLSQASAQLDGVQSTLATVGTARYTSSQETAVWGGLRSAQSSLKDYLSGKTQ